MKLSQKGRFAPPPRLSSLHSQSLSERLARWDGVHARTHWFLGDERTVDGADFYVGEEELGHLHLDGEAHVATGRRLADALVAKGLARPFAYSRAFVTWPTDHDAQARHAEFLFALRHAVLTGLDEQAVLDRLPR